MKKKYIKPTMMVCDIEPMVLLAGSGPDGFSGDLDHNTPVDGPSALSGDNEFKSCWED